MGQKTIQAIVERSRKGRRPCCAGGVVRNASGAERPAWDERAARQARRALEDEPMAWYEVVIRGMAVACWIGVIAMLAFIAALFLKGD